MSLAATTDSILKSISKQMRFPFDVIYDQNKERFFLRIKEIDPFNEADIAFGRIKSLEEKLKPHGLKILSINVPKVILEWKDPKKLMYRINGRTELNIYLTKK